MPTHRMNISVPRALKRRLDDAGGAMNVSAVCAVALETALDGKKAPEENTRLRQEVRQLREENVKLKRRLANIKYLADLNNSTTNGGTK